MKAPESRKRPSRSGRAADDVCECGTKMVRPRGRLRFPVHGELMEVSSVPYSRCPRCRDAVLRFAAARQLRRDAIEMYRGVYGLLAAEDVERLREARTLTRAELAGLLRVDERTVTEWESGDAIQTPFADLVLRCIRDLPGCVQYLRGAGFRSGSFRAESIPLLRLPHGSRSVSLGRVANVSLPERGFAISATASLTTRRPESSCSPPHVTRSTAWTASSRTCWT